MLDKINAYIDFILPIAVALALTAVTGMLLLIVAYPFIMIYEYRKERRYNVRND